MSPEKNMRPEHPDPHEQNNPVPKVVLGLVLALVVWAVGYIFVQETGGQAALGDRRDPVALAQGADGRGAGGTVSGAQIFAATCQACHQATGKGLAGVFPPLAGSPRVLGDPALVTQIVLHGMTGPIEVLGSSYNGAMPNFGEQLKDAELAAVLSYVRSQWGNGAPAVDTAAVSDARKASASRDKPWNGLQEIEKFLSASQ